MAALSCGASCMKYILFLFNIIFFITGAAVLGIGIWLKVDPNASNILEVVNLNGGGRTMEIAIYVLIGVGAFIFLVGFLGCCGACRESSCMLCLYAGLLVIVFIMEIAVAVLAIIYRNKISTELEKTMQKQVNKDVSGDPKNAVRIVWDKMQLGLSCCGAVNAADYENGTFQNDTKKKIPESCCGGHGKEISPDAYTSCLDEYNKYKEGAETKYLTYNGCVPAISSWITKHAGILIGIGFGIGIVQLFGIIFACCVRSEINRGEYS